MGRWDMGSWGHGKVGTWERVDLGKGWVWGKGGYGKRKGEWGTWLKGGHR